jgi:hypothetical protein
VRAAPYGVFNKEDVKVPVVEAGELVVVVVTLNVVMEVAEFRGKKNAFRAQMAQQLHVDVAQVGQFVFILMNLT